MKIVEKPTYISLFSSAGIGCYGFKLEGFDCVATNELITRRLEVQKFNKKCKYESGYICGDITEDATKNALYVEAIFKKPGVENEAAKSEYDKFFQQPIEMLANK